MTHKQQAVSRSLTDWLSYLEQQHPSVIDLGLERVGKVARAMQLTEFSVPVITVAGTNGKGSTCRLIEQLLISQGYRVGVYSSPHMVHYEERVRIDNQNVCANDFCRAFMAIEQARGDTSLTYFEAGTLAALWLFKHHHPDFIVLEVGLGGRLDATNIVDADVAVVTTIALDHQNFLGNDLAQIGREKAGIFRSHGKVVIGDPHIVASVMECAKRLQCQILANGHAISSLIAKDHQTWRYQGQKSSYSHLPMTDLPIDNAVAALAVIEHLDIHLTHSKVAEVIGQWQLPGRMQRIHQSPDIYLDVAHNPQSAEHLAATLKRHPCHGQTYAVCGMLTDKDNQGAIATIKAEIDHWFIAGLYGARGDDGQKLAIALANESFEKFANVTQAYQYACAQANPNDRIIVFGSFVTVTEVMNASGG